MKTILLLSVLVAVPVSAQTFEFHANETKLVISTFANGGSVQTYTDHGPVSIFVKFPVGGRVDYYDDLGYNPSCDPTNVFIDHCPRHDVYHDVTMLDDTDAAIFSNLYIASSINNIVSAAYAYVPWFSIDKEFAGKNPVANLRLLASDDSLLIGHEMNIFRRFENDDVYSGHITSIREITTPEPAALPSLALAIGLWSMFMRQRHISF